MIFEHAEENLVVNKKDNRVFMSVYDFYLNNSVTELSIW